MATSPKVVLLEGDAYLARDRLTLIKKTFFKEPPLPTEWVVFEVPEGKTAQKEFIASGLNTLGAEIRYLTWDAEPKTIVLRGLFNDPKLLVFLYKTVVDIPEGVTFIIWDETGVISSEKGSKDQPSWKGLRKLCANNGKAFNFGDPLSDYGVSDDEKVAFVVSEVDKKQKKISHNDAMSIVYAIGADRGMIITEIAKLAEIAEGDTITRKDVMENVMPLSVDFPTWKFDSAFNSGNRRDILAAAEMLVNDDSSEVPWDYCKVLGLALKMARWHVIVAYAAFKGLDMVAELNKYTSGACVTKELKGLPSHSFKTEAERDCLGKPPNSYSQSDIISLVRNLISRKSSASEAYNTTMDSFLWLYHAHARSRMASPEEAKIIFNQAIMAYTDMISLNELFKESREDFLNFK